MSYKAVLAASFCLFTVIGLASAQVPNAHRAANNVSLVRLIANPRVFDGHSLRLVGFLDHNGIDKAVGIYITELDGRNFILSNSVDLHVDESSIQRVLGRYVILEGTYHAPKGPLADYTNGYLDRISGIKVWNQGDISK